MYLSKKYYYYGYQSSCRAALEKPSSGVLHRFIMEEVGKAVRLLFKHIFLCSVQEGVIAVKNSATT